MTLLRVRYDDANRTALVRDARHPEPAIVFDHRLDACSTVSRRKRDEVIAMLGARSFPIQFSNNTGRH
jgi:hypothetical protein